MNYNISFSLFLPREISTFFDIWFSMSSRCRFFFKFECRVESNVDRHRHRLDIFDIFDIECRFFSSSGSSHFFEFGAGNGTNWSIKVISNTNINISFFIFFKSPNMYRSTCYRSLLYVLVDIFSLLILKE